MGLKRPAGLGGFALASKSSGQNWRPAVKGCIVSGQLNLIDTAHWKVTRWTGQRCVESSSSGHQWALESQKESLLGVPTSGSEKPGRT